MIKLSHVFLAVSLVSVGGLVAKDDVNPSTTELLAQCQHQSKTCEFLHKLHHQEYNPLDMNQIENSVIVALNRVIKQLIEPTRDCRERLDYESEECQKVWDQVGIWIDGSELLYEAIGDHLKVNHSLDQHHYEHLELLGELFSVVSGRASDKVLYIGQCTINLLEHKFQCEPEEQ
ncbi:MAG: hypothetical protein ACON5A_03010 [Candidatus Comchoanobacterales bacterium]